MGNTTSPKPDIEKSPDKIGHKIESWLNKRYKKEEYLFEEAFSKSNPEDESYPFYSSGWFKIAFTRTILIGILLFFIIFFWDTGKTVPTKILVLLISYSFVTFIISSLIKNTRAKYAAKVSRLIIDLLAISILILITGRSHSPWWVLFILTLISMGKNWPPSRSLLPIGVGTLFSVIFLIFQSLGTKILVLEPLILICVGIISMNYAKTRGKLESAIRHLNKILEYSPDPIIILNNKSRVILFNRHCVRLWNYSFSEARKKPIRKLYASKEKAEGVGQALLANAEQRIENHHTEIKNKQGEIIPINLSAMNLLSNSGNRIVSIGIFKDLRENNRLQSEIVKAQKLASLGQVAQALSHDIKNQLAAPAIYIDSLLKDCDPASDPNLYEVYQNIKSALESALNPLQDIINATSPKQLEMKILDIGAFLKKFLEKHEVLAKTENTNLHFDGGQTLHLISADFELLRRVFSHLLSNSLVAINQKRREKDPKLEGFIEITTRTLNNPERIRIGWRDNGCGIEANNRKKIYEPFFSTNAMGSGTGFGLFLVKKIVLAHGGEITVEPNPSLGAEFLILFPKQKELPKEKS